jgi:hypothetical protein
VLIDKSSSGTSRVTANTPLRNITTTIGFLKLDSSPPHPRLPAQEDNISPQSDGTDILRFGTIKPSTSRTASRPMTATSTP